MPFIEPEGWLQCSKEPPCNIL